MANWTFEDTGNFDAEQAERVRVFRKIAPKKDWKRRIKTWIDEEDFDECNEAAIWFTGAGLEITRADLKNKKILVECPGYYSVIGS